MHTAHLTTPSLPVAEATPAGVSPPEWEGVDEPFNNFNAPFRFRALAAEHGALCCFQWPLARAGGR